jgi:hypothetical protein
MQHKFNIDIAMTATIDGALAMKILTDAVEKETGKKVSEIRINYNDDGSVFRGFHIVFDPHSTVGIAKKQSFKPTKEFIVNHFGAEE